MVGAASQAQFNLSYAKATSDGRRSCACALSARVRLRRCRDRRRGHLAEPVGRRPGVRRRAAVVHLPCVLPLLPVYLSFISGVGVDELGSEHRRLLWTSLLFVAGFTVVFVIMGAGAGGVGRLLIRYSDELTIVAGAFIVFSGLVVAGVVHMPEPVRKVAPSRRRRRGVPHRRRARHRLDALRRLRARGDPLAWRPPARARPPARCCCWCTRRARRAVRAGGARL